MRLEEMNKMFENCKRDLDTIGIAYGKIGSLEFRPMKESGRNIYGFTEEDPVLPGFFNIVMNTIFMDERVPEQTIRGTMFHELLHTVHGCFNHGKAWRRMAEKVEESFPECMILPEHTEAVYESIPVEVYQDVLYNGKAKYMLRCRRCGEMFFYCRLAKNILEYKDLYCKCGGSFHEVEVIGEISPDKEALLKEKNIPFRKKCRA